MSPYTSSYRLLRTLVKIEYDVVQVRQRARQIAQLIGFDSQQQTRIATAVSELARNAYQYAGGGVVDFSVEQSKLTPSIQGFFIRISDSGPSIPRLKEILSGQYIPPSGLGFGILGAKRLMDEFFGDSSPDTGTIFLLGAYLPSGQSLFTTESVKRVIDELARSSLANPYQELEKQNQELLRTLDELRNSQLKISEAYHALSETNHELEETNRGVVALYTELDEKAEELKRANQIKTRFLSHMSHEFRTPINSIIGLSKLLLEHLDGELTEEQDKQIRFINRSANDILDMVNDLLDLSKVEAGKTEIRKTEFSLVTLFSGLKGLLRPLQVLSGTDLIFGATDDLPLLNTDMGKIEQILRNLISNALKFTDKGHVHVSATSLEEDIISITVQDTGIGISPENLEKIFEEFTQIDSSLQRRHKGTGLGLPLVKKLATLLGGEVRVTSQVGIGSAFTVTLPRVFTPADSSKGEFDLETTLDPTRDPILVIEDNRRTISQYKEFLLGTSFQVIPARSVFEAKQLLTKFRPVAIIQDILLTGEPLSWPFLIETRKDPSLKKIPVIVVTAADEEKKAFNLGASAFGRKPLERKWLIDWLSLLVKPAGFKALIIDDEEVSRYLLRNLLSETHYGVVEAVTAEEGICLAAEIKPDVIFLDFVMPGTDALEVLKALKTNPDTQRIPVIIHSSKVFTESERLRLQKEAVAILPKETPSREIALARLREALVLAQNQSHLSNQERKHA